MKPLIRPKTGTSSAPEQSQSRFAWLASVIGRAFNPQTEQVARSRCPYSVKPSILFKNFQSELITPEEMGKLKGIIARVEALEEQIKPLLGNSLGKERRALRDAYEKNPTQENFDKIRNSMAMDRMTFDERSFAARKAAKNQIRKTNREALQIGNRVLERARAIVIAEMQSLSTREQEEAKRYGLPYIPGNNFGALQNLLNSLQIVHSWNESSGCAPKTHLAGIIEFPK